MKGPGQGAHCAKAHRGARVATDYRSWIISVPTMLVIEALACAGIACWKMPGTAFQALTGLADNGGCA